MGEKNGSTRVLVQGQPVGFRIRSEGAHVIFKFIHPLLGNEQYAFARACLMSVHGTQVRRVAKSETFSQFYDENIENEVVHAVVEPVTSKNQTECEWNTSFFAACAWIGDTPPSCVDRLLGRCSTMTGTQNLLCQEGQWIYKSLSGTSFISFKLDEEEQTAQFNGKVLYQGHQPVDRDWYKSWPRDKQETVFFNAEFHSSLLEHVQIEKKNDGGMETEIRFKPKWRCTVVWLKERPTEEQISIVQSGHKSNKVESSPDSKAQNHEYCCGRLYRYLDRASGIIMAKKDKKDRPVLFKLADLVIDGCQAKSEDRLSDLLKIGDILSMYVKPLIPAKTIGDLVCNDVSVQSWKGKLSAGTPMSVDKDANNDAVKSSFPPPSEATHRSLNATIIELDGSYGKAMLSSSDPNLQGQRVLLSKNRIISNGRKLNARQYLHDHLRVGDKVGLRMSPADPTESRSEYEWLALVAWTGEEPKFDDNNFMVVEQFRAKVIKLDLPSPDGVTSGVAQIYGSSSYTGQRVFFSREITYVFGAKFAKADLSYIINEGDKMQVELDMASDEEMERFKKRYGTDIRFKASLAFIGPMPKFEEDCDNFPHYVGSVIFPYLQKRGMDEEFFTRLIKGELTPKLPHPSNASSVPSVIPSPASDSSNTETDASIPPVFVKGRVIELKRPDTANSPTVHGIVQIETGPCAQMKAFFNRSTLWCFGHHMLNSDLMKVVKETDMLNVEIQGGTNNPSVPYKITLAWIGSHPQDKNATIDQNELGTWMATHGVKDREEFLLIVQGLQPPLPFFPLPSSVNTAKVLHIFPGAHNQRGGGSEFGILKVVLGPLAPTDVIFERANVFLWNVNVNKGDLSYIFKEGDRVKCEVSEIIGKDKKKWQSRLPGQNLPRYQATIVYIGGGRPKAPGLHMKTLQFMESNINLVEWLGKRGLGIAFFSDLINGLVFPKGPVQDQINRTEGLTFTPMTAMNQPPPPLSAEVQSQRPAIASNGSNPQSPFHLAPFGPSSSQGPPEKARLAAEPTTNHLSNFEDTIENPIVKQAKELVEKAMSCFSPSDPRVGDIITSNSDYKLALFLSKTLDKATEKYRSSSLGPIGPPSRANPPPRDENNLCSNKDGLYGLETPLLSAQSVRSDSKNLSDWRSHNFFHESLHQRRPRTAEFGSQEPPQKRISGSDHW